MITGFRMSLSLPVSTCHALIRSSIDLRQLYRHAATACEPGLRMVLNDNAHTLDLLVADLQAPLAECGARPCRRGSWRGVVHRHLAGWLMRIAARRDHAWIHLLAHHEGMLLRRFEQAIAAAPAESVLRRQLPRLRGIHLDMHSLGGTARY